MTNYIFKRGNIFYYRRRIPKHLEKIDNRDFIKISLETKDEKEAIRKASIYNDYIEDYWRSLIRKEENDTQHTEYQTVIRLAKLHGFAYKSATEIAKAPLDEVIGRITAASTHSKSPDIVSAILGGQEKYSPKLSECTEMFFSLTADRVVNKSAHQLRKWQNPRKLAIENLIDAIGDIHLASLARAHTLQYRQWWVGNPPIFNRSQK